MNGSDSPILPQTVGELVALRSSPSELLLACKLDKLAEALEKGDHRRLKPTILEEAGHEIRGAVPEQDQVARKYISSAIGPV